ncbi:MAG: hypothetical protein IPK75_20460 [Acidobacteria bacterium]|nr:hypothetical protein [Acidobacteriota bacterium]
MQTPTTAIQALKISRQEAQRAAAMSPARRPSLNEAIQHLNDAIRDEEEDPAPTRNGAATAPKPGQARHKCGAIDCQEMIAPELAFCRRCWFALPIENQRDIRQAYDRWCEDASEENRTAHLAAMRAAMIRLRENPPRDRRRR